MSVSTNRTYLPNLDGVRFLGAFIIMIFHLEGIKSKTGRQTIGAIRHFYPTGNLVVSIFFVLSGFLITYLLLKEKQKNNFINIKSFYKRRILRVWPLYYLVLILGFFVFPILSIHFTNDYSNNVEEHFWLNFTSSFFFLQPSVVGLSHVPMTLGPIWSIKVEEAFYFLWPFLLVKFKDSLKLFIYLIVGLIALKIGIAILLIALKPASHAMLHKLLTTTMNGLKQYRIGCMTIGGIGAYMVVENKQNFLSFIFRKDVQWIVYAITVLLFLFDISIPIIQYEFYSILFCIIIVNLGCNPNSLVNLEYKWLSYLGKTAYGIYMYNAFTRILCLEFIEHVYGREVSGWQMETLLFVMGSSLTILVAVLSYEFFEKPFLRRKKELEIIPTE